MNRCDICGREINESDRYHTACLRRLFGTTRIVKVQLNLSDIPIVAQKMAGKMSISGVQPKLTMTRKGDAMIPIQTGGQYILKPQTQTFRNLPENENLCMNIASQLGIDVPPHGLFDLKDGSRAYIIRRFDRTEQGGKKRCEDFSQILGFGDKYSGSVEQIGRRLKELSDFPGIDAQLLFERILLFFLIGNGDAHLKNYSMLETEHGGLRLSPAYDIVCSKLVIQEELDSALTIRGKHNKLQRRDFEMLSDYLNIPNKARGNIMQKMNGILEIAKHDIPDSHLPVEDKEIMVKIIEERWKRIFI
jgi:serine/threonine-protein kinase HipA